LFLFSKFKIKIFGELIWIVANSLVDPLGFHSVNLGNISLLDEETRKRSLPTKQFLPPGYAKHAKKGSFYLKPFVYFACFVGPLSLPFSLVPDNSFHFCLGVMPEVDQETQFAPSGVQIVQYLGPMLGCQVLHSLYLNDDLVVTHKISHILLLQPGTPVAELKAFLLVKGNPPTAELQSQAFLVYRFQEPCPHIRVDVETCPDYPVALIRIQQHNYLPVEDFFAN
jgi:hypothetical protein